MTNVAEASVRVDDVVARIRTYLGGQVVADTTRAKMVWAGRGYPEWWFPREDVADGVLAPSTTAAEPTDVGTPVVHTVRAGGREAPDAAHVYAEADVAALSGHVRFDWHAMDAWFEEDEEVYYHVRNPFVRVDILPSSRTVRVEYQGQVLAESDHAMLLVETGPPPRWYLPKVDVRMDLLTPTATTSRCPYKGEAEYWSVQLPGAELTDVVWSYRHPLPESERVAGMVSFWVEKGMDLFVDGVRQEPDRGRRSRPPA